MLLNQLRAPKGAAKNKKRLGRGESSGLGKTAGKGHKGQKARSGGFHKLGYEGGQMPLARRLPKRGFTNIFKKEYALLNVSELNQYSDLKEIDLAVLQGKKVFKKSFKNLKVLGNGDIKVALTVKAAKFTKTAVEKIEKAGGSAIVIN